MIDINIAFAAGSAYDGKQFGLSALTSDLLAQGNAGMDATQIAEKWLIRVPNLITTLVAIWWS